MAATANGIINSFGFSNYLDWGMVRAELEKKIERTRTKHLIIIAALGAAGTGLFYFGLPVTTAAFDLRRILPEPLPFLFFAGITVVGAVFTWYSMLVLGKLGNDRVYRDRDLAGKIPVAVAAITIGATNVVLARTGGTGGKLVWGLSTVSTVEFMLGKILTGDGKNYALTGYRVRSLGTAQDAENFLRTEVLAWLTYRVGGKNLPPPMELFTELHRLASSGS